MRAGDRYKTREAAGKRYSQRGQFGRKGGIVIVIVKKPSPSTPPQTVQIVRRRFPIKTALRFLWCPVRRANTVSLFEATVSGPLLPLTVAARRSRAVHAGGCVSPPARSAPVSPAASRPGCGRISGCLRRRTAPASALRIPPCRAPRRSAGNRIRR